MLFHINTIIAFLSLGSAAPFQAEEDAQLERRQSPLPWTAYSTPGINWAYAKKECTTTQLNILSQAAITTQEYLGVADYASEQGWAFQQYFLWVNSFGPAKAGGWKGNADNIALLGNIRNSIALARLWATSGDRKGRNTENRQISYRCAEQGNLQKCATGRGVGAYTSNPARTGNGWQITFCPVFFEKSFAADIAAKGKTYSINALISHEHLMAHEYMHVGMLGHCDAIIDVQTTLLPSMSGELATVYGASRCKEWAWLNVPFNDDPLSYRSKSKINPQTALNADNYAWYATSAYFSWKWHATVARREANDALQSRDDAQAAFDPAALGTGTSPYDPTASPAMPDEEKALFDDDASTPDFVTFTIDDEGTTPNQGITFDSDNADGDADVTVNTLDTPKLPWPQNCHGPSSTNPDGQLQCDFIGEEYETYASEETPVGPVPTDLPDANSTTTAAPAPVVTGTTCTCNEDGCTADSPACCANGTCPSASPSATPTPAPAAYAPGSCSFHLEQFATCEDDSKNLYAKIKLYDNGGSATDPIGETPDSDIGVGINDGGSYSLTSKLSNAMVITGEHSGDYVQFTIGGLSFQSSDSNYCSVGGWDPKEGGACGSEWETTQNRNMDCSFPCPAGT